MPRDAVREVLREAPALGVLPDTYLRLSEVLRDPNVNSERIAAVVRLDPGLTARLLRLANSAAMGASNKVENVSQAATRIGTNQLHNLALSTSIVRMFRGMPEHLLDMRSFWTHSIAVGFATSALARAGGQPRTESLFVRGLLHDVGTLVMCLTRPGDVRRVLVETENSGRPHEEVEREMLGYTHEHIGTGLMRVWGLPDDVVQAVRFHHRPSLAPTAVRAGADLVHVADVIVSALQIGNGGERAANSLDPAAWRRLGLSHDILAPIVGKLRDQVSAAVALVFDPA